MWRIIDDKGTIYSGSELEMRVLYEQIVNGEMDEEWYGDLLLVQIHNTYK